MCGVPGTSVLFPSCPAPFPHPTSSLRVGWSGDQADCSRLYHTSISTSKYVCVACVAWCAGWHPAVWGPTPQPERWRCRPHARGSRGWPKGHAAQHAKQHARSSWRRRRRPARRAGAAGRTQTRAATRKERTYVRAITLHFGLSLSRRAVCVPPVVHQPVYVRGAAAPRRTRGARGEKSTVGRGRGGQPPRRWRSAGRWRGGACVRTCVRACVRLRAAPRRAGPRRAHAAARAGARR